jgi:hypothetical protein
MKQLRMCVITGALALCAAAAPPASADIFAVTETAPPAPRTDVDVAQIDASTGNFTQLPAGINTAANEFHPSVAPDGSRMVFERVDPSAGTHRIILADLRTGQTADLFNAFEVGTDHPTSPAIDQAGATVFTGGPWSAPTETDVRGFPAGPYPHRQDGSSSPVTVVDPFVLNTAVDGFPADAERVRVQFGSSVHDQIVVFECCGPNFFFSGPAFRIFSSNASFAHPAISPATSSPVTVLFDQHVVSSTGALLPGDIGFCSVAQANATSCDALGLLPPIVDSSANETRPAFTSDGRYVGFVRDESGGHERLFIWDTQTQTMLNGGVDLGAVATTDSGNLSLFEKPVFRITRLPNLGTVSFSLLDPSNVGILVQRVVGHHQLLGRSVPTLRRVGRVPFGRFRAGSRKVRWDLRVNGKRLAPGTYQVTVRALTQSGLVRDMGKPRIIQLGRRR